MGIGPGDTYIYDNAESKIPTPQSCSGLVWRPILMQPTSSPLLYSNIFSHHQLNFFPIVGLAFIILNLKPRNLTPKAKVLVLSIVESGKKLLLWHVIWWAISDVISQRTLNVIDELLLMWVNNLICTLVARKGTIFFLF